MQSIRVVWQLTLNDDIHTYTTDTTQSRYKAILILVIIVHAIKATTACRYASGFQKSICSGNTAALLS